MPSFTDAGTESRKVARRWEIDEDAVRLARARLGLRHPVEVKITSQRSTAGRYKGLAESRHRVTISTHICPSEAGQTLWHELTHARQRERYHNHTAFMRALDAENLESEAERAERLNSLIPLCRPR